MDPAKIVFGWAMGVSRRGGAPARILLDLDGTADPAHGQQEGVRYHGYYR